MEDSITNFSVLSDVNEPPRKARDFSVALLAQRLSACEVTVQSNKEKLAQTQSLYKELHDFLQRETKKLEAQIKSIETTLSTQHSTQHSTPASTPKDIPKEEPPQQSTVTVEKVAEQLTSLPSDIEEQITSGVFDNDIKTHSKLFWFRKYLKYKLMYASLSNEIDQIMNDLPVQQTYHTPQCGVYATTHTAEHAEDSLAWSERLEDTANRETLSDHGTDTSYYNDAPTTDDE
jgi:hypothetical protein